MTEEAKKIIEKLSLEPLEGEGGYFRFLKEYGNGAGCIYYLVTEESFSHLHLLSQMMKSGSFLKETGLSRLQ
ncbi:MAG: hypothetical protein KIG41_07570 [Sphaerochaetaceae bacterium]|nr:hypothetical protein [Sphaerochaetaceae bacterium]